MQCHLPELRGRAAVSLAECGAEMAMAREAEVQAQDVSKLARCGYRWPRRRGNSMPIRNHVSELSDEARLEKLDVKRRAKPRELVRQHQVDLIKWVRSIKDAYPVLKLLYAVPNGG